MQSAFHHPTDLNDIDPTFGRVLCPSALCTARFPTQHLHLLPRHPDLRIPRRDETHPTHSHDEPAEDLHVHVAAVVGDDERARDGAADEGGEGDGEEVGPVAHADLADVRDLRDERADERDEGARGEAVEGREDDDGRVRLGGDPQRQHDQDAEEDGEDHHVEAAVAVAGPAGEDAAGDAGGERGLAGAEERWGGRRGGDIYTWRR